MPEVSTLVGPQEKNGMFEKLNRVERWIFDILSLVLVIYYSYSAVLAPAATQYHRGIYVVITYVLVFLLYRSKTTLGRVADYLLIAVSAVCIGYWMWNFEAINYRVGAETDLDQWIAMAGVLLGIELARRVVGERLRHPGRCHADLRCLRRLRTPNSYLTPETPFPNSAPAFSTKATGVFGIMANVLATYVILFVIFWHLPRSERSPALFRRLSACGGRAKSWRTGQGVRHRERPVRVHLRQRHRQHRLHRQLHHPDDEESRLQASRSRRHRARSFHRRHVHASYHGAPAASLWRS